MGSRPPSLADDRLRAAGFVAAQRFMNECSCLQAQHEGRPVTSRAGAVCFPPSSLLDHLKGLFPPPVAAFQRQVRRYKQPWLASLVGDTSHTLPNAQKSVKGFIQAFSWCKVSVHSLTRSSSPTKCSASGDMAREEQRRKQTLLQLPCSSGHLTLSPPSIRLGSLSHPVRFPVCLTSG